MILLQLAILIFSIVAHEVMHGYMAYRRGDDTAYMMGRLTLNPINHVDLVGTIIVPALCYHWGIPIFGWAKPVPVNPSRLDKPRADMGKVALAGPLTNLALAVVCAVLLRVFVYFASPAPAQTPGLEMVFLYGVFINLMLFVLNLIPIPPLDGSKVVYSLLPYNLADKYESFLGRFGMWIVIIFILSGGARHVMWPIVQFISNLLLFGIKI